MRKLIGLMVFFLILVGLFFITKKNLTHESYVLRINNFPMSKEEFEEYFKQMNAGKKDSPENRKKVLETLVNKKIILQEAEKEGLQKSKEFLKTLQDFYEQLLFKMILDKKSKELGSKINVSDEEVKARYQLLKDKGLVLQPLSEVYEKIKWQVFREKQTQALDSWLQDLRKKARIEVKEKEILNK